MNDSVVSSAGLFHLYGLNVAVQEPLNELMVGWMPDGNSPIDLTVRQASTGEPVCTGDWVEAFRAVDFLADGRPEFVAKRQPSSGSICLTYHDGIRFTVNRAGTVVDIVVPEDVETPALLPALLGPIMGVAMRQRGQVCLHGSAVALGRHAVALVGDSGSGKSTTVAAFARRGNAVLSDDVLPVRQSDGGWLAVPAYPKLRLWPESAQALMGSADALPPMMPGWSKRALDLAEHGMRFQSEPLPLAAIYFLGPRQPAGPTFSDVPPADAMMRLVSDSFASRAQTPAQRAAEFQFLGKLVRELPLRQVCASNDLKHLDALCVAVEADALRLRSKTDRL